MKVKVLQSAGHGTTTVARWKELTKYDEHMYWTPETEFSVHIVVEANGKYYDIATVPADRVKTNGMAENYGYNVFLKYLDEAIERGSYFTAGMLDLCKELGKYDQAADSLNRFNERVEKRRAERLAEEEKERMEEDAKKKAEEQRKEDMINKLKELGLVKPQLSRLQTAQLISNLENTCRFEDLDERGKIKEVSWYSLITEYGYTHFVKDVIHYGRRGLLANPRSEYYVSKSEHGSSYQVPGNLGKFMVLDKTNNC